MSDDRQDATPDRAAVLTALTTEHFTLQGARGSTISESTARASLYVGALSSALIALGLIAQASELGTAFDVFLLVVLPTLYALGLFTFVRLVESSIEDLRYGRAINRIRAYYLELAGDDARYFVLRGNDDIAGVLANMGMERPSRFQLYFTIAAMVSVLNAVVGGVAVAYFVAIVGAPGWATGIVAGLIGLASLACCSRWQLHRHTGNLDSAGVIFPSPDA